MIKRFFSKLGQSQRLNYFIAFFKSAEMSLSSIAVAYYLLLSVFPLFLIIGNSLPYFNIDISEILEFMKQYLPEQIYGTISSVARSLLSQPNTGLLSISVLAGFWTFSKALTALQMAFNKAYEVSEHRDIIISRIFSILAGFAILIFLYLAVTLATFGQMVLERIHASFNFNEILYRNLHNLTVPAVATSVFLALMLLYFILPNVRIKKIRYVLPGAVFSTFVLVFLTSWIGNYISRSVRQLADFKIVGSLLIFALMLWFIFLARVLIFGAILNAVYQKHREGEIVTRRGEIVEIIRARRKPED